MGFHMTPLEKVPFKLELIQKISQGIEENSGLPHSASTLVHGIREYFQALTNSYKCTKGKF